MDPNVLRDHLTKLHAELRAVPRVDSSSGRLLGELTEEINQLLARSNEGSAPAAPASGDSSTLPGRLEKIAVLFEVDHPTLAASSRRLVDMLGKVGL